nr:hypothetical protein [Nanoarchaeum sp.]
MLHERITSPELNQRWNDAGSRRYQRQCRFEYMRDQINAVRDLSDTQIRLKNIEGDLQFIQGFTQKPQGSKQDPLYKAAYEKVSYGGLTGEEQRYFFAIMKDLENRSMCEQVYTELCNEYIAE